MVGGSLRDPDITGAAAEGRSATARDRKDDGSSTAILAN